MSIILNALEKTDTSGVWSQSDALPTVYRGKLAYVADAVRGLFVNAFRPGVHMALEGQFSKGCPGDCDGDSLLTREGPVPNLPLVGEKHFPVQAKIALYPMGIPDYIDKIAGVWRMAEKARLNPVSIHYATRISGVFTRCSTTLRLCAGRWRRRCLITYCALPSRSTVPLRSKRELKKLAGQ